MAIEHTGIAETVEAKLERLAVLKKAVADATEVRREYDDLRQDIQMTMQAAGMDKTKPAAGIYALISREDRVTITDEEKVAEWLEDNVMDPMEYYKLDASAVRVLQAEKLSPEGDGELIPGLETITQEVVSIRAAKK